MEFTNTKTWQHTLAPQGDEFDSHRERLKQAYFNFRRHVGQLIQTIPADILGLTIHDLTHLDALWSMSDLLTNGDYDLNPAEAFVFGGSILLHDSAMTVCAYKGGADEVRNTPEYSDALAQLQSIHSARHVAHTGNSSITLEALALSDALRIKHASKAEELASQKWISPIDGSEVFLIDDAELRDHFSRSIGRIAHSHHWDIGDVQKILSTTLGAFSSFPVNWTIDQVKIALLLRCVDAMQIDDRRAPRFLASVRSIPPESIEHWRFQNKLTQPHIEEGRLIYTSKSPFVINEAAAWNLCFDTLQMIDRELRSTNDLHLQKGLKQFSATSVVGAGSAEALSRYIEVEGWKPLPLNLKVSNVPHLARTLGGNDLYNNPLVPLRELIQNSADAIEARTLVESDFSIEDGLISIRFIESEQFAILELEDNGVGMSEFVLTTGLLDFGYSYWKSAAARSEFPGLQQYAGRFRGRYGIGFFSVFMWASEVTIYSRRFNEGMEKTRVLEFRQGIESRPILRAATTDELSSKWSTRIRLKLKPDFFTTLFTDDMRRRQLHLYDYPYRVSYEYADQTWTQRIKLLCGALPIKVILEASDRMDEVSLPKWRECTPGQFMDFFSGVIFDATNENLRFINTLTELTELPPLGGRCFITPYKSRVSSVAVYEKGIFIGFTHANGISGIAESNATNAARDRHSELSARTDKIWFGKIRGKVFSACRHIGEKIAVQNLLMAHDEPDPNQPLFIKSRELISLTELKRQISSTGRFFIRLHEDSDDVFVWKTAEKLSAIFGLSIDEQQIFPLVEFSGKVNPGDDIELQIDDSGDTLFRFLRDIRDAIGPTSRIESEHHTQDGYKNDFIDIRIFSNLDA